MGAREHLTQLQVGALLSLEARGPGPTWPEETQDKCAVGQVTDVSLIRIGRY